MKDKQILKQNNIVNIILIILILGLGTIFVYINLVQYKLGLNADIAAEGLLAKVIWESKEWIPSEWYFSTESRLISVADCAAVFYGMSKSICLSMGLSCIVAGIFIIGSLCYLCIQLEFSTTQKLFFVFLVMMLPNNKAQIELLFIYAGHYAFHIGLYFLTLALYLKMLKKKKIGRVTVGTILLLHFILGVQGVRGVLMITGPLMTVEVVRRVYLWWSRQEWRREDNAITCFAFMLNVLGYLGGKIPISIGQPLSRNIRKAPQKLFETVLPDFLNTFDWIHISKAEKIVVVLCLVLMLYLIVSILGKGIKKENIEEENWILMNFFVSVLLTIAALVFTTVDSSSRYFVTVYFAIAMCVVVLIETENKFLKSSLIFMMTVLFVGNCYRMYYPMIIDKTYKDNVYVQVGEYLVQEGYEQAYSDFEKANTLTVYNDGKIQISAVNSFADMEVCKWLTSRKWYVPNVPKESKTAYVVPDYCIEEIEKFLDDHEDVEFKTKIGIYSIYGSDYNYSMLVD